MRGEPDASSFPNGGTRSTSRARGYSTWDPTSPAFIRSGTNGSTLYIPTCFCSWTGDALDVKTPLLRSSASVSTQASRLLRMIGDSKVKYVTTSLGAEQEFFVVDRSYYAARPDLLFAGRTLFGSKPPKGQELDDHYFATIPPRVLAFIQEVEGELWKLGVPSRASHNEAAPGQHEISPIYETLNIASDHNMIQMELLQDIAMRHNLAVLLHEKPFSNVNGSGKHNNWSLTTDYGLNLLEPSMNPRENILFQVFLTCVLHAVDVHADLLRAAVATPGNDWRLGMSEAPPAIMSVYLGAEIQNLIDWLQTRSLEKKVDTEELKEIDISLLHVGSLAIAPFKRDKTDRNRTSPFAFTGNKFEFRAVGSSQNVGHTMFILNTIMADSIKTFADQLENLLKTKPETSVKVAIHEIINSFISDHKRIIFDGDGYSQEWIIEAEKRGLPNLKETVVALEAFCSSKNIELFNSLNVLNPRETMARYKIYLEHYINTINVEANCVLHISKTFIIPCAIRYQKDLAESINSVSSIFALDQNDPQITNLKKVVSLIGSLIKKSESLSDLIKSKDKNIEIKIQAEWFRDIIKPLLLEIRKNSDNLEEMIDDNIWSLPRYSDMLFTA